MYDVCDALKRNLRRMLCERNMTAAELADRAGISRGTIYNITDARVDTSISNIYKISKALGVKLDALVKGADE